MTSFKYQPIKAPITPERAAAMKQLKDGWEALNATKIAPNFNLHARVDYEHYRGMFEQWVLHNFYCPRVSDHFRKDKDGIYNRVVYDKRDSTKFSQVEGLWQAFKLGLRTDLS